jgi:AcrR family transcriptional regulator
VAIRSVAQRVGVTPPSIYLHFADKDALLDAVCARYFENLGNKLRVAAENCTTSADILHAQGMAYVRFALQAPALYRLATMVEPRPASGVDDALFTPAISHMRAVVQSMIDEGTYSQSDANQITYELFTVVHGVVTLFIAKPYWPLGDAEAFADKVLRAMCCGQIATGMIGYETSSKDAIEHLMSLGKSRRTPRSPAGALPAEQTSDTY